VRFRPAPALRPRADAVTEAGWYTLTATDLWILVTTTRDGDNAALLLGFAWDCLRLHVGDTIIGFDEYHQGCLIHGLLPLKTSMMLVYGSTLGPEDALLALLIRGDLYHHLSLGGRRLGRY